MRAARTYTVWISPAIREVPKKVRRHSNSHLNSHALYSTVDEVFRYRTRLGKKKVPQETSGTLPAAGTSQVLGKFTVGSEISQTDVYSIPSCVSA